MTAFPALTHTLGPHWPWELGHSRHLPTPSRATGTSALSAIILLWHPGALVPTLSSPKDGNVRWQELLSPTFRALPSVHSTPALLMCRRLKESLPALHLPSRAPSAKGGTGTLQVGQLGLLHPIPMSQFSPGGPSRGIPLLCTLSLDVSAL